MRQISLFLALLGMLAPELRAGATQAKQATLRSGDAFEMKISGVPVAVLGDMASTQYTIGPEGTIKVNYIGKVQAVGLTAMQLADLVEAKFVAAKVFTNPTVIVSVAQQQRFVSVSGGVRMPQRLQWTADLTLASAIGSCQGLGDYSSFKGIKLIREGKIEGLFNLKELEKDPAKDPKLLPGDQVVVPKK